MKRWFLLIVLLLCACSVTHQIRIPKNPCFYPFQNYDFTLCKKFKFYVDYQEFIIDKGFATDLATVPRILWSLYSPMKTETIPGAVIHDYLYFCPGEMSRQEADAIFYDALVLEGLPQTTAFRYWLAVRLFGKSHFNAGAVCTMRIASIQNTCGKRRSIV